MKDSRLIFSKALLLCFYFLNFSLLTRGFKIAYSVNLKNKATLGGKAIKLSMNQDQQPQSNHIQLKLVNKIKKFLKISKAIENSSDIFERNNFELIKSAKNGDNIKINQILLINEFDINAQDKTGKTALAYATIAGHFKTAELLIKAGASSDIPDVSRNIPLMHAIIKNNPSIIKLLISNTADLVQPNKAMIDPISLSTTLSQTKTYELLKYKGVKHSGINITTPIFKDLLATLLSALQFLYIATQLAHTSIALGVGITFSEIAWKNGLNKIKGGNLKYFINSMSEIIEKSIDKVINDKADLFVKTGSTFMALTLIKMLFKFAIERLMDNWTKNLLNKEAPDTDKLGTTPLLNAVLKNDIDQIKILAENRENLNKPNKIGVSPLALSITLGQAQTCKFLRDSGATLADSAIVSNFSSNKLYKSFYFVQYLSVIALAVNCLQIRPVVLRLMSDKGITDIVKFNNKTKVILLSITLIAIVEGVKKIMPKIVSKSIDDQIKDLLTSQDSQEEEQLAGLDAYSAEE